MPDLTIGWEYLTGYAVATDPASRDRAEWPPHPGRVFMALAAAYFETDEVAAEGEALRWLETLGEPELYLPTAGAVFERSRVTVYVPVNDKAGPSAATLQSAPAMTRSKQPRTFPRMYVGNGPCFMYWPRAEGVDKHRVALDRICRKVTRIGHSSSLVRMWVSEEGETIQGELERFGPNEQLAEWHARRFSEGMLEMLREQFGEPARQRQDELYQQIAALNSEKKAVKGKGSKERKAAIDEQKHPLNEELSALVVRPPVRPKLGLWTGYSRTASHASDGQQQRSHFDTDLLVLTHVDGPKLPVVSTLTVAKALHGAVMKHCRDPEPAWVSGHQSDGSPCDDEAGHLAFLPLPFVGREHADGHLLGVALAFPRAVDRRDRGQVLGPLLLKETGEPRDVELKLGRLGVWMLRKRDWSETRYTVAPETWTAHPKGTATWASVTPMVLDKFPKADRRDPKQREAWELEVRGIIADACIRIDLPRPIHIDIDTTSWHIGSPRAVGKRRSLRGYPNGQGRDSASLGDGFPDYPAKGTNASRPQVHVFLQFAEPVVGPVLLGAGRYRGYGLCKPWEAR